MLPARKSVGFEKADVTYRRIEKRGKSSPAPQREDAPAGRIAGITLPVERRLPTRSLHSFPARRQPEFGTCVCASRHEFQIFTARDFAVCDLERLQIDLVSRSLRYQSKNPEDSPFEADSQSQSAPVEGMPFELRGCDIPLFREGTSRV